MSDRVQKVLSRAGVASRREGERLLQDGKVRINGRVVTELGTRVSDKDVIEVNGSKVPGRSKPAYYLMYKPRDCVTTLSDPQGRRTVRDHLPRGTPRVFPIGRLDYASEGMLLFTNDGDLAQALLHPKTHVAKTYHVKVRGRPSDSAVDRLRRPFRLSGRVTRPAQVDVLRGGKNAVLAVTLTEGRKNQIREMFWRVQHPVLRLRRVAFGPVHDPTLGPGQCRALRSAEVAALRAATGTEPPPS